MKTATATKRRPRPAHSFTADDLVSMLRDRYAPPEYAFLPQVRNGTGFARMPRTADGLAMSLWPSRGLHLHGFEVKISRGDFLRELHDPAKAEEIQRFCHFWWIVTPSAEMVDPTELPPTWGLLASDGKRLQVVREAPFLSDAKPLDPPMLAAVFRAAQAWLPQPPSLTEAMEVEIAARVEEERLKFDRSLAVEKAHKAIERFKQSSGIDLLAEGEWNAGEIGEAVRLLRDSNMVGFGPVTVMQQTVEAMQETASKLSAFLKEHGLEKKAGAA